MSGSFAGLPKYPGESEADRAKLLNVLRPAPPAPPDSLRERVRHLLPVLILGAGVAFAGFVALGTAILLAVRAVDAGLGSSLVLIAAFLALPAVAVAAAVYQRHRDRQRRGWS
jgi:hypothetical protein